jgi:hypothetical protein
MKKRSLSGGAFYLFFFSLSSSSQTSAPATSPPTVRSPVTAIQLPPDQKAYQAADAIVDADKRTKALQAFRIEPMGCWKSVSGNAEEQKRKIRASGGMI